MADSTPSNNLQEFSPAFEEYLDDVFKALVDPISLELMLDPVMTVDNMTYERETIDQWFQYCEQHGREYTSPVTNQSLSSKELRPNIAMKSILTATIKYLETKDREGVLATKAKNMLNRYQEYEREKAEKLARDQALENEFRSRRVLCRREHNMVFMRQNRVPSEYISRYRLANITCDLCQTSMIHQAPHHFYFNCATCNFDVCEACVSNDDYQERINSISTQSQLQQLPRIEDIDDLEHLEELLRLMMRVPRVSQTPVAETPAVAAPPPRQQRPNNNAAEERPSRLSRFMNSIRNTFRSSNHVQVEDPRICRRGHVMMPFNGEVPPRYNSVVCDLCGVTALENSGHEYFHCSQCRFDVCSRCSRPNLEL